MMTSGKYVPQYFTQAGHVVCSLAIAGMACYAVVKKLAMLLFITLIIFTIIITVLTSITIIIYYY